MSTILVTGGSGMVGQYLKKITENDLTNKWIFLSSRDGNLSSLEDVRKIFEQYSPKYVIHLAANVGGLYKHLNERVEMFRSNLLMNQYVVDCCHEYGVQKAIFCLSTCVFPANPPTFPMTEEMIHQGEPHPSNASYAYTKRMLKQACDNYNWQYNRQYICVCPVNLYGMWDNFNLQDSHVIPGIIHKMYLNQLGQSPNQSGKIVLPGSGKAYRQFLYAEDFARLIHITLFEYEEKEMIICAPDDEIQILDLVQKTKDIGKFDINIEYDSSKSDGIIKKTASNSYLKQVFPDFCFTSLESGLSTTIQWFKENYNQIRK